MKQSQAVQHLQIMMRSYQRYRDNGLETIEKAGGSKESAAFIWPWIWGDKCALPIVAKILDGVENTGKLAPMDYYNMIVIATSFANEIGAISHITDPTFPLEQDIQWLRGWDPEE